MSTSSTPRSRTPLVIGAVVAVVAVIALVAVLVGGGGDEATAPTVPAASGPSGTDAALSQGVVVDGEPLPQGEGSSDPAIGSPAPALSGFDYAGQAVDIAPGTDGPMMVVFLAHWCPHCNAEVPVLLDWEASGDLPAELQVVGVSTAVAADRPNYPPGQWLADKGWDWPVIADDVEQTAVQAYGVTGYPYITFIDADGNVVARTSGEQPIETLQALADATVDSA
jgi:cytochrome c biogenesis protein CcmG, thiol:disulfide interchange protein DsbE